jgi:signal transduction histidine kinase
MHRDLVIHLPTAGRRAGRELRDTKRNSGRSRGLLGQPLIGLTLVGLLAAGAVGYLASENPAAQPAGVAVTGRVLAILLLLGAGVYATTSRANARMGRFLIGAALVSAVWLLNGAADPVPFSMGVLVAGAVPTLMLLLLATHPAGELRSPAERRFFQFTGGAMALLWIVLVLTSRQPPLRAPLMRCSPHCPANAFYLGVSSGAAPVLRVGVFALWLMLAWGTAVLISRRSHFAPPAVRYAGIPVKWTAIAYAVLLTAFLAARAGGSTAEGLGTASTAMALLVPIAIVLGLAMERLRMGRALAGFVTTLVEMPRADPQPLMAVALGDPTLRIAYRRPAGGSCVDSTGAPIETSEPPPGRALTWINRERMPVAAVIYDALLADQEPFIHAAGVAALLRLESARLEADLKASTEELAASRSRLIEVADAERRRIERDLHDSVQQDLTGLRIKLEAVAAVINEDPDRGQRMISSMGREMDAALVGLRSLALGIYPPLLTHYGVAEALKSAARSAPMAVSVAASDIRRYPPEVEVAIYFCCLEGLQNSVKHAGNGAAAVLTLTDEGRRLRFELADDGVGFDSATVAHEHGLLNMRDRIETVGGTLTVSSSKGHGTVVSGFVPIP